MVKWSRYLPSKHKMLAEDPSSILGGSKRHLEDSGTTFFAFLPFSIVHSLCCIAWENKRKISFKSEDPFGSSDRTPWPGRWQGRKRTAIVAILDVWNCTQNVVWLSAIYVHRWPLLSYSAHRYCECFASGLHCNSCNCSNCCNNLENTTVRQEAVESTLERNPNAFRPKIAPIPGAAEDADGAGRHNKVRISFQIAPRFVSLPYFSQANLIFKNRVKNVNSGLSLQEKQLSQEILRVLSSEHFLCRHLQVCCVVFQRNIKVR